MVAKSLLHKFHSAQSDAADATLVRPSNWNDDHNLFFGNRSVTSTSDTLLDADHLSLVKYSSSSAVAVTLPQPGSGGQFLAGWTTFIRNAGTGLITITPTSSTINGGSNVPVAQNQGAIVFSNGTIYDAILCDFSPPPGGNVSNVGTPANGQIAQWTDATHIQGVDGTTIFQPLDADLTTLAALGNWKVAYTNGAGNQVALSIGTANYALVSTGPAAAPSFQPVLQPNVTNTISVGYTFTPNNLGTISSGTTTPTPTLGNYQYYTNNGAHTIAAPTSDCAIDIMVTNGASAGAITFTGFTYASANFGDALTTTSGNRFIISIRRINAVATLVIKALQ